MMVLEKVSPFKNGHLLVSMVDFWVEFKQTTVDGWNLAPPGMYETL